MTAVDLDALDAARAAATPGPWARDPIGTLYGIEGFPAATEADAALIVAAVNALPELVARLRRVEALAEELLRPVDYGVTHYRDGLRDAGRQIRAALAAAVTSEGERE